MFAVQGFCEPQTGGASLKTVVEVEEVLRKHVDPGNGSGTLWCYGSTIVVRDGNDVYVCVNETGVGVPLLCNTAWQLWHKKGDSGWDLVKQEAGYHHREPCPIGIFPGKSVFISANPSMKEAGVQYGRCEPEVLEFKVDSLSSPFKTHMPAWAESTNFTDHSYRGFCVDGEKDELLLLQINAGTSEQFVSFMDSSGKWHEKGTITFPVRACYPQVALRNGAAHVMAVGDIVEPVERWQKMREEKAGKKLFAYVFRRIFYTSTPDIGKTGFSEPIEIDSAEATCGSTWNQDLYLDDSGTAHLLYIKQPHLYTFIRDAEFPGEKFSNSLEYVTIKNNQIISRRTLLKYTEGDTTGLIPSSGRFHVDAGGKLYVIMAATDIGKNTIQNYIARISEDELKPEFCLIEMQRPFGSFATANTRAGCKASDVIDMFGHTVSDSSNLSYARIRLGK